MKNTPVQNTSNPDLVWYVSYGSNLNYDRFSHYISGGRYGSSRRSLPGCSDTTPPRDSRALTLPYQLYFGGLSRSWNGAVAFINPESPGNTLARAYLITVEQFWQIVIQETTSTAGIQPKSPADLPTNASGISGKGMYDRPVECGELEGLPLLTFTTPKIHKAVSLPTPAYIQTIGLGLCEVHGLSPAEAAAYLEMQAGITGHYDRQLIQQLVEEFLESPAPTSAVAESAPAFMPA